MSLQDKIGQLFIFGFSGQDMSPALSSFLLRTKPGGLIFFKRNIRSPERASYMTYQLQELAIKRGVLPFFLALDQEGGLVTRIATSPAMPSALALGQTENPELARSLGFEMGRVLRSIGFNMNLAPVLDISDPSSKSFIGSRSFGPSPEIVSMMTSKFSQGLVEAKVLPTAKHFPGVGSVTNDPHVELVKKIIGFEQMQKSFLPPFRTFFSLNQPKAVMISHIIYPELDEKRWPATFSHAVVTDLLRTRLGYNDLIITDDVMMDGAKIFKSPEEAALRAVLAGADLIMITWSPRTQQRAIKRLLQAVSKGELSEKRIDESLKRILMTKLTLDFSSHAKPTPKQVFLSLKNQQLYQIDDEILNINLSKQLGANSQVRSLDFKRVVLMSSSPQFNRSFSKVKLPWPTRTLQIQSNLTGASLKRFISQNQDALLVIPINGTRVTRLVENLPLQLKQRILAINLTTPGVVDNQFNYLRGPSNDKKTEFLSVVNLYHPHERAGLKVAQWLARFSVAKRD